MPVITPNVGSLTIEATNRVFANSTNQRNATRYEHFLDRKIGVLRIYFFVTAREAIGST